MPLWPIVAIEPAAPPVYLWHDWNPRQNQSGANHPEDAAT